MKKAFKGFETWLTSFKMKTKMYLYIFLFLFFIQILLTLLFDFIFNFKKYSVLFKYFIYSVRNFDFNTFTEVIFYFFKFLLHSKFIFAISFAIYLFFPKLIKRFEKRAEQQEENVYVRGTKIISEEELSRETKSMDYTLKIGSVQIPRKIETMHFFICGRPGTGKTQVIRQIVSILRERNEKAIIYDFKGDYLCKFYDPSRDFIFNPLDQRCVDWNVFNEIETSMDIDSVATSLIPPAIAHTDPFWNDAARDVFAGILHFLYREGKILNSDIWTAVTAPGEDIADWLKRTPGGERGFRYIEDASSKQALSVFAVMMQYVKPFEFMAKTQGDFSLKRFIENNQNGGFIFVTSYAEIEATLRPILSLMVDLLGRRLLSLHDDYNRRVFFILDEFGTLQRLSTIQKLLTLSRSKGGSVWISIQDVGQLDQIYGHSGRQTIVNACSSSLIFSVADPETANFLSARIGDTEYWQTEESWTSGTEDTRDSFTLSRKKKTEKLILPSQIQSLNELRGFLQLAGYNPALIDIKVKDFKDVTQSFLCRDDLILSEIIKN